MSREVSIGRYTKVICLDEPEPGAGGACHNYEIVPVDPVTKFEKLTEVYFQNGTIKENRVNGCMNEDLLAIVIDRLQGFQAGQFACRENATALTKLQEALHWLNHRTNERIARGVEDTLKK